MADCTDEEKQQTRHSVTVEIAGAAPVVGVFRDVAQLGEHRSYKAEVVGSYPTVPTLDG